MRSDWKLIENALVINKRGYLKNKKNFKNPQPLGSQ